MAILERLNEPRKRTSQCPGRVLSRLLRRRQQSNLRAVLRRHELLGESLHGAMCVVKPGPIGGRNVLKQCAEAAHVVHYDLKAKNTVIRVIGLTVIDFDLATLDGRLSITDLADRRPRTRTRTAGPRAPGGRAARCALERRSAVLWNRHSGARPRPCYREAPQPAPRGRRRRARPAARVPPGPGPTPRGGAAAVAAADDP